jgi:transcriptional regulator with XRE-family HTH domain
MARRNSIGWGEGAMNVRDAAGENLTYLRIVERVTSSGLSQRELGEAVGASLRAVQNWASGGAAPRGSSRNRLLDVQFIVSELSSVYTPEGVDIWVHARNRNLGSSRPLDLLRAGEGDRVLEEAQRLSGAM